MRCKDGFLYKLAKYLRKDHKNKTDEVDYADLNEFAHHRHFYVGFFCEPLKDLP